jgi:hypothetical protein
MKNSVILSKKEYDDMNNKIKKLEKRTNILAKALEKEEYKQIHESIKKSEDGRTYTGEEMREMSEKLDNALIQILSLIPHYGEPENIFDAEKIDKLFADINMEKLAKEEGGIMNNRLITCSQAKEWLKDEIYVCPSDITDEELVEILVKNEGYVICSLKLT